MTKNRVYVCIRVLEDGEREIPVHFECVPEVYHADALAELGRLRVDLDLITRDRNVWVGKAEELVKALRAAVAQLPDRCEHEREMARIAIAEVEDFPADRAPDKLFGERT